MYCGACARDSDLARALKQLGHEVAVFPIYTPLRLEEDLGVTLAPLRIGGINAFLREKVPKAGRLPKVVRGWLDNPSLIAWASRFAVRTQASDLGQMTVSFLAGVNGPHGDEIRKLADAVSAFEPDIALLANSLLAGLIEPLRSATGVPVVCQVQGEDGFLDELPETWRERAQCLLREQVRHASGFIAPCRTHADEMAIRLEQSGDRFSVVPPSVRPVAHPTPRQATPVFRLGHLSSIRKAKGLDLLVEAIGELKDVPIELSVRGRVLEPRFYESLIRLGTDRNVRIEFGGEVRPQEKLSFLSVCDFIVLPSRLHESRGIAALEALAAGTPVIAPNRGIFPELAEKTGGVALYASDEHLASTIRQCVIGLGEWRNRGMAGARFVTEVYSPSSSASAASACFNRFLDHSRR